VVFGCLSLPLGFEVRGWVGIHKPVEKTKTVAQTLKEKRRLNGMGREKNAVAVVVMMMMLKKKDYEKIFVIAAADNVTIMFMSNKNVIAIMMPMAITKIEGVTSGWYLWGYINVAGAAAYATAAAADIAVELLIMINWNKNATRVVIANDNKIGISSDFRAPAAAASAAAGALALRSFMREMKGVMSSPTTMVPQAARRVSIGRCLENMWITQHNIPAQEPAVQVCQEMKTKWTRKYWPVMIHRHHQAPPRVTSHGYAAEKLSWLCRAEWNRLQKQKKVR
jgi:hypothetical protein